MYLTELAGRQPEKIAIKMLSGAGRLSYAELNARSNRYARGFRKLGLRRGDHIALVLPNVLDFLPLCLAAERSGLYYTALSYRLQGDEIDYIISDSGSKVALSTVDLADRLTASLKNHPQLRVFCIDGTADGCEDWADWTSDLPETAIDDESPGADMLYSSGTTGRPKGILRPLPEPGEEGGFTQAIAILYGMDENTVYLSPAPLYHAAPLRFCLGVLGNGGCLVIAEHFDAETVLRGIETFGVTHSQWVPTMFVRMLKLPEAVRQSVDISSLVCAVHAAAPCPVDIKRQMIEWWGPVLFEYYAGTEANGLCFCNSEQWLENPGTVGAPLNCRVHILDEDFSELPPGQEGGVYFSGGGEFEYHNDDEKTRSAGSPQGYTTLGDIGYLNERGFLFLTDRKAHTIISGGVNIYPQETEDTLVTHPAVLDAAVIGVPNPDFGEEVKAVVQLIDPAGAGEDLADELIAWCRSKIADIKCPRSVDFVEELPRHPTGKLYKRLLKERYWKGHDKRI
ncbi:MAG: acyl-CoA synthetase [Gammaproteobacteria bacterium AqS3]|nr:acyl-CoA synthetase [Gammaproteobacteria bacterium AqS3]